MVFSRSSLGPRDAHISPRKSLSAYDSGLLLVPMIAVLTAQPDKSGTDTFGAGDSIAYKIDVYNTGNTCLRTLTISDLLVGPSMSCDMFDTGLSITRRT